MDQGRLQCRGASQPPEEQILNTMTHCSALESESRMDSSSMALGPWISQSPDNEFSVALRTDLTLGFGSGPE